MAIGECHQLSFFGRCQGAEHVWKDVFQRPAEPDIEKVREVSVRNVVVIGRIGRNHFARTKRLISSIVQVGNRNTVAEEIVENFT